MPNMIKKSWTVPSVQVQRPDGQQPQAHKPPMRRSVRRRVAHYSAVDRVSNRQTSSLHLRALRRQLTSITTASIVDEFSL